MAAKYFWITRGGPDNMYEIWFGKPQWNKTFQEWDGSNYIDAYIPGRDFEITFGIHLKGGPRSITRRKLSL